MEDNRMKVRRCNAYGEPVDDSWRFDLVVPATLYARPEDAPHISKKLPPPTMEYPECKRMACLTDGGNQRPGWRYLVRANPNNPNGAKRCLQAKDTCLGCLEEISKEGIDVNRPRSQELLSHFESCAGGGNDTRTFPQRTTVHVGSSNGRFKAVPLPPNTVSCPSDITVGPDSFLTQVRGNELHVYRKDRDSGWGQDLSIPCQNDDQFAETPRTNNPIFIGQSGLYNLGNSVNGNVPVGNECRQPCGKECRAGNNPQNIDDVHCNRMDGNRMEVFRCDRSSRQINDTWRFDLTLPCTTKP